MRSALPSGATRAHDRAIADSLGPKLTRPSREARSSTGVRDHRHSLPVRVAATLAAPVPAIRATAPTSGHWRPAHGPLGFPLFLRPPGASLSFTPLRAATRAQRRAPALPGRVTDVAIAEQSSRQPGVAGIPTTNVGPTTPCRCRDGPEAVLHLRSAALGGRFEIPPKSQSGT